MKEEGKSVIAHLVSPGDAVKDTLLAGAGFSPALFMAHVETALFLGLLNLLLVAIFRGVELYLKYFRNAQVKRDADSTGQD